MPTDDCHINYREHLDDMQYHCAHGQVLKVYEVIYRHDPEDRAEAAMVVSDTIDHAIDQATGYQKCRGLDFEILHVRVIGDLLLSE